MLAITNSNSINDECVNLLNIGGTSGSDCAAGIVFGGALMAKTKILKQVGEEKNGFKISY
jgi:hypothetical protein